MRNVSSLSLADDLTITSSQDKILWECQHGGELWHDPEVAGDGNSPSLPDVVCRPGWNTLFTVFIIGLLADVGFQVREKSSPDQPVC